MPILITGGSGLIGASLTQMIVELGERPAIFDIAPVHPILLTEDELCGGLLNTAKKG